MVYVEIVKALQARGGARAEALARQHIVEFQQEIKSV